MSCFSWKWSLHETAYFIEILRKRGWDLIVAFDGEDDDLIITDEVTADTITEWLSSCEEGYLRTRAPESNERVTWFFLYGNGVAEVICNFSCETEHSYNEADQVWHDWMHSVENIYERSAELAFANYKDL